jgi:SAM-dependent methyltransferase
MVHPEGAMPSESEQGVMMDDIARYNLARWKALVEANSPLTQPALDLDPASARQFVDPEGLFGDLAGKDILCLASGGGRQSVAFALLGARVSVFDLSDAQLARDREAATHYGVAIEIVQGDMRDLSQLPSQAFDIVYHPYALNFVPIASVVFAEVARVLRRGGRYYLQCANPFYSGIGTQDWNGEGYTLRRPYVEGAEIGFDDEPWVYDRDALSHIAVPRPREYRHTLSAIVNGLVDHGFLLMHLSEFRDLHPDASAAPGSWQHLTAIAPPWLAFWSLYRPETNKRLTGGND